MPSSISSDASTATKPPKGRPAVPTYRGPRLRLDPHPEAPDPVNLKEVRAWVRRAPRPTALDLFCGAGGLSLGLVNAGFTVLVGADNDPWSVETHRANIGGLGYLGDLADPTDFLNHLDAWGIRNVDLVAGGVPCQPFSRAGRSKIRSLVQAGIRPEDDPRTALWRSFVEVVRCLRPRAVLLENVPDLAVWNDGAVLVGFRDALRQLGYTTTARIVNAFDHGVPQHRARLFVIGLRAGRRFEWPEAEPIQNSLRDAIGDLPEVPPAHRIERLPYEGPLTALQRRLRQGVPESDRGWVYDHITRDVRPDDAEAFALLKPGQTYKDLPKHLQRYRSDIFTDKYNRLRWDGLSRTITAHMAKDAYWYIHPEQDRTLSIREAARVQTFPDWFRFAGEPSHRFRQIGNAVPPLLAEALGRNLAKALMQRGCRRTVETHFRKDLLRWHKNDARSFPWRCGADPWHVLMAETCLRRTRADQVVPVYRSLTEIAKTPQMMVENAEAVLAAMRSLGLHWRAENMLEIARAIVEQHENRVPNSIEGLLGLPGVGDYTAHAVMVFAFGRCAVLLDTNTERVLKRLRGVTKMDKWQIRSDIYDFAGSAGADAAFNYALIDLAALICRPREPLCSQCPVKRHCESAADDKAARCRRDCSRGAVDGEVGDSCSVGTEVDGIASRLGLRSTHGHCRSCRQQH
ncbi:DNA (cytosine-5-)-methyltransferase [Desulforudis sp. 1088]|uniref:DNA cytosine methyltransferase n=1 Tax=unclassified Candidatus Desulforudis TaxID=2635950 RepID=UPI003CE534C9